MTLAVCIAVLTLGADPGGLLAFTSGTNLSDQCACVLDVASGAVTRVGEGKDDGAPQWSPDGQWLAHETRTEDGLAIRVVKPDGSEARLLKHQFTSNRHPRWSPEGKRLLYLSDNDMGLETVVVVYNLKDDTEEIWANGHKGIVQASWLPSLKLMQAMNPDQAVKIEGLDMDVFKTEAFGLFGTTNALVTIGLQGDPGKYTTEPLLVTHTQAAPLLPLLTKESTRAAEWGIVADIKGERMAYESNSGGDREIYIIGKRGLVDVTNHRDADWNPVWSPDGKWLAFESFRGGRRGVYRVFPDTARVFPVATGDEYDCWAPTWSPDGKWLAYVSDLSGDPEIHATNIASGEVRQLTHHPGPDYAPAWQPKPKPTKGKRK
jgi:Tol biopolymer transport system component